MINKCEIYKLVIDLLSLNTIELPFDFSDEQSIETFHEFVHNNLPRLSITISVNPNRVDVNGLKHLKIWYDNHKYRIIRTFEGSKIDGKSILSIINNEDTNGDRVMLYRKFNGRKFNNRYLGEVL